jgi:hypothetical protein
MVWVIFVPSAANALRGQRRWNHQDVGSEKTEANIFYLKRGKLSNQKNITKFHRARKRYRGQRIFLAATDPLTGPTVKGAAGGRAGGSGAALSLAGLADQERIRAKILMAGLIILELIEFNSF